MVSVRPPLSDAELSFLLQAVGQAREGHTAVLAQLISAGLPVNLTNGAGDSLLILAAYHCHADTVRMLLARGADTERVNDHGQTALAAATFRRHAAIVSMLLAAGADPYTGDRSALHVASFFGLTDMAALLGDQAPDAGSLADLTAAI